MPGTSKRETLDLRRTFRDPPPAALRGFGVKPRAIEKAWASINSTDIEVGELVFNRSDNSLVYRKENNIYRIDNDATRTV